MDYDIEDEIEGYTNEIESLQKALILSMIVSLFLYINIMVEFYIPFIISVIFTLSSFYIITQVIK